jgi:hypothetical protein
MPDYLVTDPATGQRIKMTGPAPPSEALIRLALAQVKPLPSHVQQTADPLQAMQKAQTIGPARVGERYQDDLNPSLVGIARKVLGGAQRPASVAAEDPYGIGAWLKGAGPMPTPIAAEIQAFHGSPHDFEKFLSEKIGTGEGAQAYGHGLYFAENPKVAQEYARNLSGPVPTRLIVDGQELGFPAAAEKAFGKDTASAIHNISGIQNNSDAWDGVATKLREAGHSVDIRHGRTYEVSIKADPDQFLDWDKPLSQQPKTVQDFADKQLGNVQPVKVKDGWYSVTRVGKDGVGRVMWQDIQEASPEAAMERFKQWRDSMSGQQIYRDAHEQQIYTGKPEPAKAKEIQVTDAMKEAGIPGIKYLDQGSRTGLLQDAVPEITHVPLEQPYQGYKGDWAAHLYSKAGLAGEKGTSLAGERFPTKEAAQRWVDQQLKGTSNYVVFDDQLIDILKKYAVAGAVGGSLASLGQPPAEEQK